MCGTFCWWLGLVAALPAAAFLGVLRWTYVYQCPLAVCTDLDLAPLLLLLLAVAAHTF
jgi:hypothetical protein